MLKHVPSIVFIITLAVMLVPPFPAVAADTYWPLGMVVGAASGAGVGVAAGYGLAPLCEENRDKCRWQIPLLAGGVLMVVGGGIGAFVGSMVEKGDHFVALPVVSFDEQHIAVGLNIRY